MKTIKLFFILPLLAMLCWASSNADDFKIQKKVIACGGNVAQNSSYGLKCTIGQPAIGLVSSNANKGRIGFWCVYNNIVGVEDDASSASSFSMNNFPNPFTDFTNVSFTLGTPNEVSITLLNMQGLELRQLANEFMSEGEHILKINREDLSSGVYFVKISIGNSNNVKKVIVL